MKYIGNSFYLILNLCTEAIYARCFFSVADIVFMCFVIITLACLASRRDALLPTAVGLVLVGTILKGSFIGLNSSF